jgi:hypothetical protein
MSRQAAGLAVQGRSSEQARALGTAVSAFSGRSKLFFSGSFQAMVDMGGTIPGKHLGLLGRLAALHRPELFGAPLFRSFAEFGSNNIRIDQLLGEARSAEQQRRGKNQLKK